jgi:integrase
VIQTVHRMADALHAYIAAAGIAADKKGFLFRTSRGHGGTTLADQPMTQVDAWRMVRKRAVAAGITAPIGNHSFRATGITAYLSNGGARRALVGALFGRPMTRENARTIADYLVATGWYLTTKSSMGPMIHFFRRQQSVLMNIAASLSAA